MSATRNVNRKFISLEKLVKMTQEGKLAAGPCQRNERWNAKDKTNYITALLRDTTFALQILITRPHVNPRPGEPSFLSNDGQNRISALCGFLSNKVQVRAGDVLMPLPVGLAPGKMLSFSDFTQDQQLRIRNVLFDLIELPSDDPEYLREVANNMNRGKPSSAAERIHSWADTHSMVGKVLNPLDRLLAGRMHKMRPHWRCKNHGLVILFARVMAITDWECDRGLWLTSSATVEAWVFRSPPLGYTQTDYNNVKRLILSLVDIMDEGGFRFNRPLFVDLCWAIDAFQLDKPNTHKLCDYLVQRCATAAPEDALLDRQFDNGGSALLRRIVMSNYLQHGLKLQLVHNGRMLLTATEINVVGFVPNEDDDDDEEINNEDEEQRGLCPESGLALFMSQ